MTADSTMLRFYVDESALGLGKTLCAARKDTIYCGHPLIPSCPLGTADSEWIPKVAALSLVVIGRDKHVRTREAEAPLVRDHGLRVFRIASKQDLATWDWLKVMVRQWDAMEDILATRPEGPWFYAVGQTGRPREIPLGC